MQEKVCECTKVHEIREHFLLQTIPDIWYIFSALDNFFLGLLALYVYIHNAVHYKEYTNTSTMFDSHPHN